MGFCVYATRRKKNRAAKKNGCAQNDLILQKLTTGHMSQAKPMMDFGLYGFIAVQKIKMTKIGGGNG